MYAFGYRNLAHAKDTLAHALKNGNPCSDCTSCTVNCAMHFNVKSKISDIAQLNDVPEALYI